MLERVSIDERLSDIVRLSDLVLDLLGDDVLSLGQFEDIFLSVNDLESTLNDVELANISSVDPTLRVKSFRCQLRLSVIALECDIASVANFSSRQRVSKGIFIIAEVVHVGDINQLDFYTREWCSDMANFRIVVPGDRDSCCTFSLSISFLDLTAECYLKEVKDIF